MRRRITTAIAERAASVAVMVLLAAGPAVAQAATRQQVSAAFTTARPGQATGLTVTAVYDGQHALRHAADGLPPGTGIASRAVPACTTSDAVLTLLGPGACPVGSVVGSGHVTLDLGLPAGSGRLVTEVSLINAGAEILFLGREPTTGVGLVQHGVLHGTVIDVDILAIPGSRPEGASIVREDFTITAAPHLLSTPDICPRGGAWTFTRGHTYGDGVAETTRSPLPCTAAHAVHRRHRTHR